MLLILIYSPVTIFICWTISYFSQDFPFPHQQGSSNLSFRVRDSAPWTTFLVIIILYSPPPTECVICILFSIRPTAR